jgi:hypothetical protein
MRRLENFIIARRIPERSARWSQGQWDRWLAKSARIYLLTRSDVAKRQAFRPFHVEPVSQTPPSEQLYRQVADHAPDALHLLAGAVLDGLGSWVAGDGARLGKLLLELLVRLAPFCDPKALFAALQDFLARVGSPLSEEAIQDLSAEVASCAIGRVKASELRELGRLMERRAYEWQTEPWRAQLAILQFLLRQNGAKQLFEDVQAAIPRLPSLVYDNLVIKHYVADMVVDALGLEGVAQFRSTTPRHNEQKTYSALRFCIFPYRVRDEEDGLLRDMLFREKELKLEEDSPEPATGANMVIISLFNFPNAARRA